MGVTSMEMRAVTDEGRERLPEQADDALVSRARGGDSVAFEQLYLRHRDRVYALCLHLCRDRELAQDLLQDTFVRAYRGLRGFRGGAQFTTWLHRIAVNLCRDAARRQRQAAEPLEVQPEQARPAWAEGDSAGPVREALGRLPDKQRTVLALRYSQSLSYQEIAEVLDWSLARVKVTLHRAKRAFREVYLALDGDRHAMPSDS